MARTSQQFGSDTLISLEDAATKQLGGVSIWTLRKHAASGALRVVRLGRRVFVNAQEISRIQREGLPSLKGESSKHGKE